MADTLADRLLAALADDGATTVTDLAALTGAHPITVDRCFSELEADGYVRHRGEGRYGLTEAGRRTVEDDG